jgi:hypothetical protein
MVASAVTSAMTLTACGGGYNGSSGKITSVSISPTSANLPLNGTAEFSASVTLESGSSASTSTAVTWEVNGTAGGNSSIGTIVALNTDVQVGVYTAPAVAPGTNSNQVNITAVAQVYPGSTTNTTTITSNTAVVSIGAGEGLAITELTTTVPAGQTHHFVATLNGVDDPSATWTVTQVSGQDVGTINSLSGIYTAPGFPPLGGSITITASDPGAPLPASASVEIVYSNLSLDGPFTFAYAGNDSSGFMSAAGSFVADGNGNIVSGVEDIQSSLSGVSEGLPLTGSYVVGADGRTTATINNGHGTATLQFALTTNRHGLLLRFDTSAMGSGTIDQQNLNDLTMDAAILTGPYVFAAQGLDAAFKPLAVAGRFSANGAGGIPAAGTVLDVNDNGTTTDADTSLSGSYTFGTAFSGTGRGTITLTSTTTGSREYAFYIIDDTHIHLVEIDSNAFLAGDAYSGAAGGFSTASLAAGNYAFTSGGTSGTVATNPYAEGGVFAADGTGHVTSGTIDTNNGGTIAANAPLGGCPYGVDGTTGRITLFFAVSTCPANPNFVAYETAQGPSVLIELDSTAVSTGMILPQTIPAETIFTGGFALLFAGQGMFHNSAGSYQPEAEGEFSTTAGAGLAGNIDIDNFNAAFKNDPLNTTTSTFMAAAPDGRGVATLEGINPEVTYNIVYYLVDGNSALVFDNDTNRVAIGYIERQF